MQSEVGKRKTKRKDATEPVCGQSENTERVSFTLALAPLDSTDMSLMRSWRNDHKIWQWCRQNDFISDFEQADWFNAQHKNSAIKMYKIVLASERKEGDPQIVPVGVCGFTSMDLTNRRAEFSLYIAPAYQGNDLGDQALKLLLTHGFDNLGFNLIWGEVFENNPALKKFMNIGFIKEGIRREFYFRDGKFIDAHLISIKASEWKSLQLVASSRS